MPGRNADLFGQLIDAVDGAALVVAADDERAFDPRKRICDDLMEERFPFPGDVIGVDLPFAHELINQFTLANRADDDGVFAGCECLSGDQGPDAGDALEISGKIVSRTKHTRPVVRCDQDLSGCLLEQRKTAGRRIGLDVTRFGAGERTQNQKQERLRQNAERAWSRKSWVSSSLDHARLLFRLSIRGTHLAAHTTYVVLSDEESPAKTSPFHLDTDGKHCSQRNV